LAISQANNWMRLSINPVPDYKSLAQANVQYNRF